MLLHEFGKDLVLAKEFGLELGDLVVFAVGSGLAAFVVGGEGGRAVLEEGLLPGIEESDGDAVFGAEVREGDLVEEMFSEKGDLLLGGEVATLLGHG